jgi:hypothetical protein
MADLQKVIDTLKENNVKDEAIAEFVTDLSTLVAQKVQVELTSVLDTDEEMARLNALPDDEMKEKTGRDIVDVTDEIVDGFVTGFLTEYHRQKLEEQGKQ